MTDGAAGVKWLKGNRQPFDRHDLAGLTVQRAGVPGAGPDARLVAVSRAGCTAEGVDVVLGPDDLLDAFRPRG